MATHDEDGNGQLDFPEFLCVMAECDESQAAVGEELKQLFQLLDANKDGSVDMAEMCQILSQVGEPMTTAELAEVMREADIDGDGKLNYDEFIGMSQSSVLPELSHIQYSQRQSCVSSCCVWQFWPEGNLDRRPPTFAR